MRAVTEGESRGSVKAMRRMRAMIHGRKASRLFRVATILGVSGILLVMMGDSPFAATSARGIDPLQVLDLSVKPNVIIVLDSSGSMQATVGGTDQGSGDHPRSKLYLAKQVLKSVIQRNSNKVTFLFGQYTQDHYNPNTPFDPSQASSTTGSRLQNRAAGNDRFRYSTNNIIYPSMTAALRILQTETDTTGRGLQNWQDIRAGWNKLYYGEGAVRRVRGHDSERLLSDGWGAGHGDADGDERLRAAGPRRPTRTRSRSTPARDPSPSPGRQERPTSRFVGPIRPTTSPAPSPVAAAGTPVSAPGRSLRATASGSFAAPTSSLNETFDANGDGTADNVTTYTMMAGRFFNGEAFTVTSGGLLCNMTTGAATVPPSFTVTPLDTATCAGGTAQTPVTFTFAGGNFTGNTLLCNGFDAKVPLVPCDATSGQLALMQPFLDNEIPFTATGGLKNYVEIAGWHVRRRRQRAGPSRAAAPASRPTATRRSRQP